MLTRSSFLFKKNDGRGRLCGISGAQQKYYREHNASKKAWKDRYESISVESKTSDIENRAGTGALLTCFDVGGVTRGKCREG